MNSDFHVHVGGRPLFPPRPRVLTLPPPLPMSNQTPCVASEVRPRLTSDAPQSTGEVEGIAEKNMQSDFGYVMEDETRSAESLPPSPTVEWNGEPMDWKSWPHGREGPYVSKTAMRRAMESLRRVERARKKQSRTKEKVFHIADFSSTGKGWLLLSISYLKFNNKPFRGLFQARYRAAVGQMVGSESPSRSFLRHSSVCRNLNLKVLIDSCE
jgi:hypothetical protein